MTTLNAAELVKDDQAHLIHSLHHPLDHAEPLIYVEGKGAVVKDIQGKEYIDGLAGLWNVAVGHGREELARAASEQMKTLAYFSGYVGSSNVPAIRLATRLVELAYKNLTAVFFTCGGAESNESAFKTARFYWKAKGKPEKVKIIARENAYHGVTGQAMSATGMPLYWKMFEPRVPGFVHIQAPYPYRFQGARPGEGVGQAAARELEEKILAEGPETVAAFIAEPIIGGGGVIVPPDDYFPRVREICTRHQVLFIADEVITGFCRTGQWFALTHWGVEPDI
ncbi:MAG: aspartate aminotransferase family protein, partial [Candidatus Rokubacteria bacterium]|nr:aspartate aminotransferase family protein [Candidatus Rokubacteria bacterium]